MTSLIATSLIAFGGPQRIASGDPLTVALAVRQSLIAGEARPILVFDATSSRPVELDLRGTEAELRARLEEPAPHPASSGRGRPKLGVTAREITLLPKQWDWLGAQRGGASATLRRLISDAVRTGGAAEARRQGQDALYRFISVMAGDLPGFEEASRALFAHNPAAFAQRIDAWPADIKAHATTLAVAAFPSRPLAPYVPGDRLAAAEAALPDLEGATIAPLTAGASGAVVLKIMQPDQTHVLRLDHPGDGFRDPARQYACHAIAAQARVAPRLLYSDAEDRVSVTAFLTGEDLARDDRQKAVARAVARLHTTPLFPPLMPFIDGVARIWADVWGINLMPEEPARRLVKLLETITPVMRAPVSDIVSSHNDLNPNNILFAGGHAWFVDWESAFATDRYVDLAAIVNFFGGDEAGRTLIAETYFGRPLDDGERARLELMRQISRLFYGAMLLLALRRATPSFFLTRTLLETEAPALPTGVGTPDAMAAMAAGLLRQALDAESTEAFAWALRHTGRL